MIEEVFIFLKNEKLRREFFIKDCLSSTNKDGLYHILIRLSKTFGSHQNKGILINLNITHEELSQFSGYSRSHISKILKKLSNKNIIEFENRKIVIKNLNWLENQINCEKCEINICST
ncbi:TPA: helix-turn-helix domain-containing protein [Staphylococcus aureus]